ncbi:transposase [Gimesia benthica]|uniref:Transposase n=1 Tax=Gimesia benthica TaxID=2608982 RepID=A0A6I6AAD5_9PLAN|nr:transposase [Gimesia benthica]
MVPSDEPQLVREIIDLASQYGRYGYRRVTELLRRGWKVNHKRVERLWRLFGLKSKNRRRSCLVSVLKDPVVVDLSSDAV